MQLRKNILDLIDKEMGIDLFLLNLKKCSEIVEDSRFEFLISFAISYIGSIKNDPDINLLEDVKELKNVLIDAQKYYKKIERTQKSICPSLPLLIRVNNLALEEIRFNYLKIA